MALTYEESREPALGRVRTTYQWAASIQAACDTLSRMPADLMNSITVTGRLDGTQNETGWLRDLSYEIARKSGLQVSVESGTQGFTARFSRAAND